MSKEDHFQPHRIEKFSIGSKDLGDLQALPCLQNKTIEEFNNMFEKLNNAKTTSEFMTGLSEIYAIRKNLFEAMGIKVSDEAIEKLNDKLETRQEIKDVYGDKISNTETGGVTVARVEDIIGKKESSEYNGGLIFNKKQYHFSDEETIKNKNPLAGYEIEGNIDYSGATVKKRDGELVKWTDPSTGENTGYAVFFEGIMERFFTYTNEKLETLQLADIFPKKNKK